MTTMKVLVLALAVSLALAYSSAKAQGPVAAPIPAGPSSAPAPGLDCSGELLNLSACLTYVEAGSNTTVPDTGCCPALASLVGNNPVCLCQLLGSGEVLGIPIDKAKSLGLPTACRVQTPPVSLCAVFGIPVASPVGSAPAPTSGGGPESPGSSPTSGPSLPAGGSSSSSSSHSTSFVATGLAVLLGLSIVCKPIF